MKKVISFILAVICIAPVGCINASAEELTMESKKASDSIVYSAGLINECSLSISSSGTSILLTAKTKGNYSMKSIGLKNIVIQRSTNGTDWKDYTPVDDLLDSSTTLFYTSNNNIASVPGGYYYRVTCNHYAKESGWFGSSESISNTSNSVYVP